MFKGKNRKNRSFYHLGEMVDGNMDHHFVERNDAVLVVLVDSICSGYVLVMVNLVSRPDVVVLVMEEVDEGFDNDSMDTWNLDGIGLDRIVSLILGLIYS
jgi:hypothetical protein